MRDTLFDFVGFIKAAFDSTIKLNFNEKTKHQSDNKIQIWCVFLVA